MDEIVDESDGESQNFHDDIVDTTDPILKILFASFEINMQQICNLYRANEHKIQFEQFNSSIKYLVENISTDLKQPRLINTEIDTDFIRVVLDFLNEKEKSLVYTGLILISKMTFYLRPFFDNKMRELFIRRINDLINCEFRIPALCAISNVLDHDENHADSYSSLIPSILNLIPENDLENYYQLFTIKNFAYHCSTHLFDHQLIFDFLIKNLKPVDPESGEFPQTTTLIIYTVLYLLKTDQSIQYLLETNFKSHLNDLLSSTSISMINAILSICIKSEGFAVFVDLKRVVKLITNSSPEISSKAAFLLSLMLRSEMDVHPDIQISTLIKLISKCQYKYTVMYAELMVELFKVAGVNLLVEVGSISDFVKLFIDALNKDNSEFALPFIRCLSYLYQASLTDPVVKSYIEHYLDSYDGPSLILESLNTYENVEVQEALEFLISLLEINGYQL